MAIASCAPKTAITALTDGAVLMRHYAKELGTGDLPISDWFYISTRIRHTEASAAATDPPPQGSPGHR